MCRYTKAFGMLVIVTAIAVGAAVAAENEVAVAVLPGQQTVYAEKGTEDSGDLIDEREFYEERRNIGEPGTPQAEAASRVAPTVGDKASTALVDEREFWSDTRNLPEQGSIGAAAAREFTPTVGDKSSTSLVDETEFYKDHRNSPEGR